MNTMLRFALATALVTTAGPAAAGDLRLSIADGHVTLVAKDVTVREILAEWARVGQTRIVNGEKLTGGPVTLELNNVPEAQALDAVLRSAAGYVMAPRTAASPGPSRYDRILILASSKPPVVTASVPTPFVSRPMQQVPQNNLQDDEAEFGPTSGPTMINGPVIGQPGIAVMPQPGQAAQPQGPITAPRPGQLPAPAPATPAVPTYPGAAMPTYPGAAMPTYPGAAMPTYPGTAPPAPTFNGMPPPPTTVPRPGGPGARPDGSENPR